MDGIVTILSEPYYQAVRDLWAGIYRACRTAAQAAGTDSAVPLPGFINSEDLPHFSWHIAESYDQNRLSPVLDAICRETLPFTVRTTGLGIFTVPKPVIFIALVKDRPLMEFHEKLWQQLGGLGQGVSGYYAPELWVPHITLAHENLDTSTIGCIIQELASQSFHWEMRVETLAIASQAGSGGMQASSLYSFTKE